MSDSTVAPTLGVIFHPTFAPETLADYARRAETAGFEELWLWDDCFLPGALSAAAIALSATRRLRVGIGILPATVHNPLFAAMEITTLARAFPGRILPGFGYGVASWMAQIGAPRPTMRALDETVAAVRRLLAGEPVTAGGEVVRLDGVQMQLPPTYVPPIAIGAMRERSLRLAGRIGDGTILTAHSSPAYVRWAWEQIRAGMAEAGRADHRLAVYLDVKVGEDGASARAAARQALAARLPWVDAQVDALGIGGAATALFEAHGRDGAAPHIPDAWLDELTASGTPDQALAAIERLAEAGADTIIFQPLDGDPDCLDEYIRCLMPRLRPHHHHGSDAA